MPRLDAGRGCWESHFAALEQPALLLADMRRFFASTAVSGHLAKLATVLRVVGGVAAALAAAAIYTRPATTRIEQDVPAEDAFIEVAGA